MTDRHQTATALDELREALESRPDQQEWLYGLGLTLEALDQYAEAAEAFERCIEAGSDHADGYLHLGLNLIRAGRPAAAIPPLARVNQIDPGQVMGYVHRILAHTLIGQHDEAEVMFYHARQLAPAQESQSSLDAAAETAQENQALAYDHLAHSLLLRQDTTRAIWCWHEALRLDPMNLTSNRNLAVVYHQNGEFQRARRHYHRQLRITPDLAELRLEFGELLLEFNRLSEASQEFHRAVEIDPQSAQGFYRLGEIALINEFPAAAEEKLRKAEQLDPGLAGLNLALARLALRQNQVEAARASLKRELECDEQTGEQVLGLADLLIQTDLAADAVRLLTPLLSQSDSRLVSDDQTFASALFLRGRAYFQLGDSEAGMEDYRRGLGLRSDNLDAIHQLADVCYRFGRDDEAQQWVKQGLRSDPDHRELRQLKRRASFARLRRQIRLWLGRR